MDYALPCIAAAPEQTIVGYAYVWARRNTLLEERNQTLQVERDRAREEVRIIQDKALELADAVERQTTTIMIMEETVNRAECRVADLEAEVKRLREEIGRLKAEQLP